jgi:predicted GNAT family acetyltransferase
MPTLTESDSSLSLLDNPIWNSLSTEHLRLALGDDLARRYPTEIGPLSGIPSQSPESYEALRELAGPDSTGSGGVVVLFSLDEFRIPAGWTQIRDGQLYQMVRQARGSLVPMRLEQDAVLRRLTADDASAMVALAELTEPGPFRLRTMELGNFYGIFHGQRLVAMAGKRMHLPGLIEVSAVCTHPDARGRGYARMLMSLVIEEIERDGQTAFLHAFTHNPAIRIYEALGFTIRKTLHLAVLKSEGYSKS